MFGSKNGDPAQDFNRAWMEQTIGTKKCQASILVWGIGSKEAPLYDGSKYKDPEEMSDCLDILGDFPDAEQYSVDDTQMFPGVHLMEQRLELSALRPQRVVESNLYLKSHQTLNTVVFKGHTIRNGYVSQRGRGHWGAGESSCLYPALCTVSAQHLTLSLLFSSSSLPHQISTRG